MEITPTESLARNLCLWIAKTAPGFVGDVANCWRWQYKALTGDAYPTGVFVLIIYGLFAVALGFGVVGVRAYIRRTI